MSASVVVPASSANLGAGFDAFGLALSLRDELRAEEISSGIEVVVSGEGADEVPRDGEHLVVRAMSVAFDHLGERPAGFRLTCTNAIPHARGLGSS
jgi:homoserine kinase